MLPNIVSTSIFLDHVFKVRGFPHMLGQPGESPGMPRPIDPLNDEILFQGSRVFAQYTGIGMNETKAQPDPSRDRDVADA